MFRKLPSADRNIATPIRRVNRCGMSFCQTVGWTTRGGLRSPRACGMLAGRCARRTDRHHQRTGPLGSVTRHRRERHPRLPVEGVEVPSRSRRRPATTCDLEALAAAESENGREVTTATVLRLMASRRASAGLSAMARPAPLRGCRHGTDRLGACAAHSDGDRIARTGDRHLHYL